MKILHIITDLDVGGAEMMLYNLIKENNKFGHNIHVIGLASDGPIGEKIKQIGVPVYAINMKANSFDLKAIVLLIKIIRNINPDLIQTWMYHADLIGVVASVMAGNPPLIWGLHHTLSASTIMKPMTKKIIKLNARLSQFFPKRVICCSDATMRSHQKQGYSVNKMLVIPNGIDLVGFKIDREAKNKIIKEFSMEPDVQLIGMMARFHPQKDHHTFIAAAEILHKSFPKTHFILAGAQVVDQNLILKNWIIETRMENFIHLAGLRDDIHKLVAALDIATLSSAYGEALPVSICEAMACGVPCVVTDVGDSKDLVSNTGLCVPVSDPLALADGWRRILSLKSEDRIALGMLARGRIEKVYNIKSIARSYSDVYEMVFSKSRSKKGK